MTFCKPCMQLQVIWTVQHVSVNFSRWWKSRIYEKNVITWIVCSSGWNSAVSSLSSDMETERPNRRWRWKFATPCKLSLCFYLPMTYVQFYFDQLKFCIWSLSRFFDLFEKYGGYKTGKLKLKKPKQLQVTCQTDFFHMNCFHPHTGTLHT